MGERYLSRAKFWKSATEPYPNVCACIGTEIGIFHGRHWWHAAGPARKQFSIVVPEIVEQLNSVFTERYSSIVIFHLYMIGRSGESAIPTIMFFCEEKEPRKMAKKTVDEGGLLVKLPGFRTGHLVRRPGVGNLIQPAGGGEEVQRSNEPELATEVYFDPSQPVTTIGMPIFVKQADNVLRRATANAVFHGEIPVYLSVAHVFHSDTSSPPATSIAGDNNFDFGSGTEDEVEDECLVATSRASMSSSEESPNDKSESLPPDSTSSSPPPSGYSEVHSVPSDQSLPDIANLEHLGDLVKYSLDLDWAVIVIFHSSVASAVNELKSKMSSENQKGKAAIESEVTKVVAHTSRGLITGRLFHDATYVRLPGSATFQKVYQTILDSHLEWGDCGVAILDAVTEQPHGHVVMSSATKEVVYIIPATQVFGDSGTRWSKADPDLQDTMTPAESSYYRAPGFRLAGRHPSRDATPLATPPYAPSPIRRDRGPKLRPSCDSCVASKVKCSKEKPRCERCSSVDVVCIYSAPRLHGKPRLAIDSGSIPNSFSSLSNCEDLQPRSLDKSPTNNPDLQWAIATHPDDFKSSSMRSTVRRAAMGSYLGTHTTSNSSSSKSKPYEPREEPREEPTNPGFRWITANHPDDFKSRSMMQTIRQTAMGSYLGTHKTSDSSSSMSKTHDSAYESREESTNPEEEQGSGKRRKL